MQNPRRVGSKPRTVVTIGKLSRRTGVPAKTLRFWCDEGLLGLEAIKKVLRDAS